MQGTRTSNKAPHFIWVTREGFLVEVTFKLSSEGREADGVRVEGKGRVVRVGRNEAGGSTNVGVSQD